MDKIKELKAWVDGLSDGELIEAAAEILGRQMKKDMPMQEYCYETADGIYRFWIPLESELDAFELVDALQAKGRLFKLVWAGGCDPKAFSRMVWLAEYRNDEIVSAWDDNRCRAITKASVMAWEYWKERGE